MEHSSEIDSAAAAADAKAAARERVQAIQAEFAKKGDALGWFEALYSEAGGDVSTIPWADLEPNPYFKRWADSIGLKGDGRSALVVGCGLGDDANFLADLGFKVTAFDLSPAAIAWAKKLYPRSEITFETANLFEPFRGWLGAFDFVLEIYTIQPLPLEWREKVIDSIARFVAEKGELVVVTRGREDDEAVNAVPWPLSRKDLSRFEANGLTEVEHIIYPPEEEGEPDRWLVRYTRG
ncbi:MAG: type 11 methyltransferase [Acidobacteria bacterium OLB17]|nr:MAG: type 11 methyltransferase [Acidobacteria bacterium OLB17]MCZ2391085.1 class I SAM-dependent methyltransferase [Acidobacteriota bacterium]